MKMLLQAARPVLFDMAAMLLYAAVFVSTKNLALAVGLGMALGVTQMAVQLVRKRSVGTLQWVSLFLVLASGSAALLTSNPQFVMLKPSVISVIVGLALLRPGWMNRYLPPSAIEVVPDIGVIFGFIWSGLSFASAAVNIFVALHYSTVIWASFMTAFSLGSTLGLILIQYAVMRFIAVRRRRVAAMAVLA
jgi:intracellular septation protein